MSKENLEIEKLKLEIAFLRNKNSSRWSFAFQFIQMIAIVLGTGFALNEFVFKTREKEENKIRATLDYVAKVSDPIYSNSQDSLEQYRELLSTTLTTKYDSVFSQTHTGFERSTLPLANYFNVLNSGIDNGFFDKKLSEVMLDAYTSRNIQILKEIQYRHRGMKNNKFKPNYNNFKGMITFYINGHDTTTTYNRQIIPHYDVDKPFKFTGGRSILPLDKD